MHHIGWALPHHQLALHRDGTTSEREQGTEEVTLIWLRTQLPHMAHRIMMRPNQILEQEPEMELESAG